MSLKQAVQQRIINEVLRPLKTEGVWRILILDKLATRMLSSCSKMAEIMAEGLTLVEDLYKNREPLPALEAIYLLTPTSDSVSRVLKDFSNTHKPLYRGAYLFFTETLPDALFNEIAKCPAVRLIKAMKEINISFVPYETRVFHLDLPDLLPMFYCPSLQMSEKRQQLLERCADQLATLCATLSEFPNIRYRRLFDVQQQALHEKNAEFAMMLQRKLEAYKADDPNLGEGPQKDRSVLLILDRGYDPMSPILHELTMQAMAYDIAGLEGDTYHFTTTNSQGAQQEKDVILDENDELYAKLRHLHIAAVSQQVTKEMKDFVGTHRLDAGAGTSSAKDLSQLMKKLPQYQKELSRYTTHMQLAEELMGKYNQMGIDRICKTEQDLAMGTDAEGEKVKDAMKLVVPVLMEPEYTADDKLRIILLYVMHKGGVPEDNLNRLFQHCGIAAEERQTVTNLQYLNVPALQDQARRMPKQMFNQGRKERNEQTYTTSRWSPYLRDLLEDVIEDKLDQRVYPFHGMQRQAAGGKGARYGGWANKDAKTQRSVPRLIVFIIGGITYSEMRCAYQVADQVKNWDVILGGSHILQPTLFLTQMRELCKASGIQQMSMQ